MSSSVVVLALAVIIGGGAALTARALGLHPVGITSSSMAPTVRNGDWIVARDLDHGDRRTLDRGDVVAFRFPLGTTGRAIKRVVALEGDRVAVSARSVTVNGRMIPIAGAPSEAAARTRVETVPPDHVFLLGDNQVKSIDSRSFGPVPQTELVARQLLVIRTPGTTWAIGAIGVTVPAVLLVSAWRRRRHTTP